MQSRAHKQLRQGGEKLTRVLLVTTNVKLEPFTNYVRVKTFFATVCLYLKATTISQESFFDSILISDI